MVPAHKVVPEAVFEIIAVGIGLAVTTIALVVPVAAVVVLVPAEITAR
ncbi:unannotated protein [freshwater metagenome]|uniref:Unannotated protein n=1 Tax=freshwater metagenome TaxID=449393 RepID=A0A6J5ZDW2_9ZZZZ